MRKVKVIDTKGLDVEKWHWSMGTLLQLRVQMEGCAIPHAKRAAKVTSLHHVSSKATCAMHAMMRNAQVHMLCE